MDSELLQGFLAQAESYLPTIRSGILVCAQTGNVYGELNTSLRQIGSVKDAALIVGLDDVFATAGELEEKLKDFASMEMPLTGEQARGLLDKLTELEALVAHIRFNAEDFSIHLDDFLDESFENLGLTEPDAADAGAQEQTDEWEDEFEIDEEMLEIFGEEAEELIQNIRANLERLEKNPDDREALLEVRRNAHTLKGSAGIVGLKVLSGVAHRVEDSLDYLEENKIAGNEKIFELLLTSTDCFGALASNETSAQLTKKIEELYKDFDALKIALKEKDGETGRQGGEEIGKRREEEKNQLPVVGHPSEAMDFGSGISDLGFQNEDQFEILDLKFEIGEEQRTKDKGQIHEQQKPKTEILKPNPQSEITNHKSIVRISLEKLDDLVKIMSGLVVSRSVFEQRLTELEQQIGEFHNSTRRLLHSTSKIETDFEADMLDTVNRPSSIVLRPSFAAKPFELSLHLTNRQRTIDEGQRSFDSLELDRYTEFHQTMRELVETTGDTSAISSELDIIKGNLEMLFENQRQLIEQMQDKLLRLRMVSFGSLGVRLQRTVRVTADEERKLAELVVEGESLEVDTQILDSLIEPLLHLLRNAVAHGIESPETRRLLGKPETGRIKARARDEGTHFILTVTDDGRGISAAALKAKAVQHGIISETNADAMSEQEAFVLVFHPGLTTADEISQVSGRGVGMNIVKTAVVRQQGTISIDSEMHKGTTFTIRLPMALAVTRVLMVKAGEQTFAFPLKLVKHISRRSAVGSLWSEAGNQIQPAATDDRQIGDAQKSEIKDPESSIFYLNDLLGLPSAAAPNEADTPLLLLKTSGLPCSLIVDEIVKPEEIVIKPLGNPLQNLKGFLGASILGDGSVVPVLDLLYLLESKVTTQDELAEDKDQRLKTKDQRLLSILIVDDSPSVRHLTSKTIKNAGWTTTVAKDGLEALDILQDLRDLPDVILTDVEMPRMNGYELLASLKKQENLQAIPVVMITSRANDKHRRKAFDLGVSEYLTKPFDKAKLIEVIKNLSDS